MRLVLIALLVLTMAGTASAADLSKDQGGSGLLFRSSHYCTGAYDYTGFYQNSIYGWGNRLTVGAGPLTTLDFIHNGYGFSGPYNYTLWIYDWATCTVVGSVPGLVAPDAANGSIQELVDLCPYNIVVGGDILVALQPLSCAIPTDCYPDIEFDAAPNPVDGCGSRVTIGVPTTCVQITSTSGVVDFLLGVVVDECVVVPTGACCIPGAICLITTQEDCLAQYGVYHGDGSICTPTLCTPVPAETITWGAVKALYR